MAKGETLGKDELASIVSREISLAQDNQKLRSDKQSTALKYFQGDMDTALPPEEGRSKAVSRDVADTMGSMLPGIMRVFSASEQMAICEPVGTEDIHTAKNATDGLNYVFWKENDGYRIIHSATWDSLLIGNGVVKSWYDDTPVYSYSFLSGILDEQKVELEADPELEIVNETATPSKFVDPLSGEEVELTTWKLKVRRIKRQGRTRVEAIPPEDYMKDGDSKTCQDARFQAHRSDKTRSELIEMGFDAKEVEQLPRSSAIYTAERIARQDTSGKDNSDKSMDIIDFYDCYARIDVNDDGIAEICHISYAGNSGGGTVLDWEEWEDETPFDDIPCEPMPHRWEARSVYDETNDVQLIKTVLLRQGLDNTYAANNPQRFVTGTIKNPDELFSPSFGGAIFGDDGATVTNLSVPFVAQHAYDGLNYQDQVIQKRTGVSRQTMALDPDALQNQTATANQNERDASYSQIEIIARNQAELGWKKVFRKILHLEAKHQDQPREIRMRGQPVTIDPRSWNLDMDISINVGLGSGSRDRDMMFLREIKQDQILITQALREGGFPDKALEMVPYILTTLTQSAEAAGIKSPELFFPEVTEQEIEEGKQRIAKMAEQPPMELQLEQAKAQTQLQIAQGQAQVDAHLKGQELQMSAAAEQQKSQAQVTREAAQLQADLQTKEADRQSAILLEQQKQAFEAAEADKERAFKLQIEMLKIEAAQKAQAQQAKEAKSATKAKHNEMLIQNGQPPMPDGVEPDALMAHMQAMVQLMAAPKRVVRDDNGRAIGVETVTQ